MNLDSAKVGDKLAVNRYGSVRLFTVTAVGVTVITAKGEQGSEVKFMKRTGKLRGDNFTYAWAATPKEIERFEIMKALSELEAECKEMQAKAPKLGARGIIDLKYNLRTLFENALTSGTL